MIEVGRESLEGQQVLLVEAGHPGNRRTPRFQLDAVVAIRIAGKILTHIAGNDAYI